MILCPGFKRNGKNAGENPPNAGSFLDIIQLQEKKRKNMMKRSYAEQWELECLL